jgi:LmbE family N-acetylglucosaminyl deacetylase
MPSVRQTAMSTSRAHDISLFDARRVLVVQPHYDDNDIGCAGTLTLLARAGAELIYVTVTDDLAGVLDPDLDDTTARRRLVSEQHAAGVIVGVTRFIELGWPDAAGIDHIALRDQIIDLIRDLRPDFVITVDPWLPHEAHSDHITTGRATSEAVILSGLPRVRPSTGTQAYGVDRIGFYFTKDANVTVDTTTVQQQRHQALDCYVSQFDDAALRGLHAALDRHERAQAPVGATHGEGLKLLPTTALHVAL